MHSESEIDAALNHCETTTTNVAGCRIVWRVAGHGAPLLLLHGNFGAWTHWIRNVERLACRYQLLIPDLPGFGESDMPPEPYSIESIAELLFKSAMTFVSGGAALSVVGFSFGTNLAGAIAANDKHNVKDLVLVSCGALGLSRPPIQFAQWRNLTERTARDRAHRENLAAQMFGNSDRIDELAVRIQSKNAERRRFPAEALSSAIPLLTLLPTVICPISAIYGASDKSIGPHMQTRIDFFKSLNAKANLAVIRDTGHWLPYETPELFEAALIMALTEPGAGWIRKLPLWK